MTTVEIFLVSVMGVALLASAVFLIWAYRQMVLSSRRTRERSEEIVGLILMDSPEGEC